VVEKGGTKVNTVEKMCTHVCKCKNDQAIPGMGRGGEFNYDIFNTL
jgi:hypothetical protein